IALVITVTAMSSGVKTAQGRVLQSLYGVGTDITVTTATSATPPGGGGFFTPGPKAEVSDTVSSPTLGSLSGSAVTAIARLHAVAADAGGLVLTEIRLTLPAAGAPPPSTFQFPTQITVVGVDLAASNLGPFSTAKLVSGRTFTADDDNTAVAVV